MKLPLKTSRIAQSPTDLIMLFYGPPGVGKTTFVQGLGQRVLFISTDRGTRNLEALRVEVNNREEVLEVARKLQSLEAPLPYDMIAVDHVDDIATWFETGICEDLGIDALTDAGYGKGWSILRRSLMAWVGQLKSTGCGLSFIAHERTEKRKTRTVELDYTLPELSRTASKIIVPLAELVGYCGFKTFKDQKTEEKVERRVLYTQPTESTYAKDRTSRRRPVEGKDWEPLNGPAFLKTFATATATATATTTTKAETEGEPENGQPEGTATRDADRMGGHRSPVVRRPAGR